MRRRDEPSRLLFLDHASILGGAELALAHHIRRLDRTRFAPHVACSIGETAVIRLFRDAGAEVHEVEFPRFRRPSPAQVLRIVRAATALRKFVRSIGADVVIANTARSAYLSSIALRGSAVPSIWWVRDFTYGRAAFRLFARFPDRFICVSHAIRNFYGGSNDPRFTVVHVGTDIQRALATITDDDVRCERDRWGLSPTDIVVGFMGRLIEQKGPHDFLEAIAIAHTKDDRVKGLVVGTGVGEPTNVEPSIRIGTAAHPGVFVLAGFQSNEALYYRLFDVFTLTSRTQEGYATSVVQAMFARVPVVATDTGGTAELVRDGDTGFLVPPHDPRSIASAIARFIDSPVATAGMVTRALEEVASNNTEEVTNARVLDVYEHLMRSAPI